MPKVKVTFKGLCVFVPGKQLKPGVEQDWVGAFLVDASLGNQLRFKTDRPPHFPFLKYKASDVDPNAPEEEVLLPLKTQDIIFVCPPAAEQEKLRVELKDDLEELPKEEEGRVFNWVIPLEDVMKGRGEVDEDCFEVKPAQNRIIARVHMNRGILATEDLAMIGDSEVVVDLVEGQKKQAAARSVSLALACDGDFEVRLREFGKTSVKGLKFAGAGESVEIEILNLCFDDLLLGGRSMSPLAAMMPDEDFRWNYLVSKGVEDLRHAIVPIPDFESVSKGLQAIKRGIGGGSGAQCSPPTSNPAPAFVGAMNSIVNLMSEEPNGS